MKAKSLEARAMRATAIFRKHAISQEQIAELVGASQGQVSRLLGGKIRRSSRLFEEVYLLAVRMEGGCCGALKTDQILGVMRIQN